MKKILLLLIILLMIPFSFGALVSYYPFDGDSLDAVGSLDYTQYDSPVSSSGGSCIVGTCYHLLAPDYMALNSTENIGTVWSISVWFNSDTGSYSSYYPSYMAVTGSIYAMWRDTTANGKICSSGSPAVCLALTSLQPENSWHHLVLTRNGTAFKLYVDKTLTSSLSGGTADSQLLYIGRYDTVSRSDFYIDEFGLYDSVLSQTDVNTLYDNYLLDITPLDVFQLNFIDKTPLNNSNFNTDIPLNYEILSTGNCSLYANGEFISTQNDLSIGNYSFDYNLTNVTSGNNLFNVTCQFVGSEESQLKTLFYDNVFPVIDYVNWVQFSDNMNFNFENSTIDENFYLNVSCTDDNLYYMNVSLLYGDDVDFNVYYEDVNTTTFVVNDSVNIGILDESLMQIRNTCADAHTKKAIRDFEINNISGGLSYDGINIFTDNSDLISFTTKKENDRYTFDLEFSKPKKKFDIYVNSPEDAKYLQNRNSFLTGNHWFDFANDDGYFIESVTQTNKKGVKIRFDSAGTKKKVSFKSIGLININSVVYNFTVDVDDDYIVLNNPLALTYNKNYSTTPSFILAFNYTPMYTPFSPDNCSLYINNTLKGFSSTVTKNVKNTFNVNLSVSDTPLESLTYPWFVTCSEEHFHPPFTHETHVKTSNVSYFIIKNNESKATCTNCITSINTPESNKYSSGDKYSTYFWDDVYYQTTIGTTTGDVVTYFNFTNINAENFNLTVVMRDRICVVRQPNYFYIKNQSSGVYNQIGTFTQPSSGDAGGNSFFRLQFNITNGLDYVNNGLVEIKQVQEDFSCAINTNIMEVDYLNMDFVTTTTTTTTLETTTSTILGESLSEFNSTNQGLFYIGLIAFWMALIYFCFTLKGNSGKPIGILFLFTLVVGYYLGSGFMRFSPSIGLGIIFVSLFVFASMWNK